MAIATHNWRRSYTFVCLATASIVAAADFFFYGHVVGWTVAAILAAMFFLIAARDTRFLQTTLGRILTLALLGLLIALIEQPFYLNVAYALLCLSAIALINKTGAHNDFTRWLRQWTRWLAVGWLSFFIDQNAVVRFLIRRGVSPARARGIGVWVLPALLTCVFIAIFAFANPIISDWLSRLGTQITNFMQNLPDWISLPRIGFWLLFAIVAWMLLRGRVRPIPNQTPEPERTREAPDFSTPDIPAAFVIRCLMLFNIVFAIQNILDCRYLYTEKLPQGMSYTEYVHRGAYPLVAAALLVGAFVLITFRPRSETERSLPARRLVYIWIAQTIFLTLSAAWRLHRYIDMSELTRLRIASIVWFFLVAMGLFYIIWRIVAGRSNAWLINANALTALLVLYPCCFINFDGIIANFNAAHCVESGGGGSPLDLQYFRTLGPTSLAALERARPGITLPARQHEAAEVSSALRAELTESLSDWRGWTWRRQRAADDVQSIAQSTLTRSPQLALVGSTPASPFLPRSPHETRSTH